MRKGKIPTTLSNEYGGCDSTLEASLTALQWNSVRRTSSEQVWGPVGLAGDDWNPWRIDISLTDDWKRGSEVEPRQRDEWTDGRTIWVWARLISSSSPSTPPDRGGTSPRTGIGGRQDARGDSLGRTGVTNLWEESSYACRRHETMACPVCGNKELIVVSPRWEECSACSARWVHRQPGEGMVILLPSSRQGNSAARDRLEPHRLP